MEGIAVGEAAARPGLVVGILEDFQVDDDESDGVNDDFALVGGAGGFPMIGKAVIAVAVVGLLDGCAVVVGGFHP